MQGLAAATVGLAVFEQAPFRHDSVWNTWKTEFGRSYPSAEVEAARYYQWKSNVVYIEAENAKRSTYSLDTNGFSDLSPEEFAAQRFGLTGAAFRKLPSAGVHEYAGEALAEDVDWVSRGAVTQVKNQGQCGSCWAFSTTGALEGAWELATGKLVSVSEQQFVDCSHANHGCGGGLMDAAFSFAEGVSLCSEGTYPYKALEERCNPDRCEVVIPKGGVTAFTDVGKTEQALMSALNRQPVSVAVDAGPFQHYRRGVLQAECGARLDHGVLAVGYGVDAGTKYWKVKNSWGAQWGERGYIRLLRGKGGAGECGILEMASFPTVNGNAPPSPAPSPAPVPTPLPPLPEGSRYGPVPCRPDEVQLGPEPNKFEFTICVDKPDPTKSVADRCPKPFEGGAALPIVPVNGTVMCTQTCVMFPHQCPPGAECFRNAFCAWPYTPTPTMALV